MPSLFPGTSVQIKQTADPLPLRQSVFCGKRKYLRSHKRFHYWTSPPATSPPEYRIIPGVPHPIAVHGYCRATSGSHWGYLSNDAPHSKICRSARNRPFQTSTVLSSLFRVLLRHDLKSILASSLKNKHR